MLIEGIIALGITWGLLGIVVLALIHDEIPESTLGITITFVLAGPIV